MNKKAIQDEDKPEPLTVEDNKPHYKIFPASPKVLAKCDAEKIGVGITTRGVGAPQAKYPFAELLIGECFIVDFSELEPTTLQNLRTGAFNNSKRRSRKFIVVVHKEYHCVEVARIA